MKNPCPFCGECDELVFIRTTLFDFIRCNSCMACGPISGTGSEEKATDAWNARITTHPKDNSK